MVEFFTIMNEREGENLYYVDFRESGGVVHSEPTRMFSELVFTGRTKSQLEIELEQHAKMIKETLGQSAQKGRSLGKTVQIARPVFLDLSLPSPGIIELKDNLYTGWFYTAENGQVYAAFRGSDNVDQSEYVKSVKRRPYF